MQSHKGETSTTTSYHSIDYSKHTSLSLSLFYSSTLLTQSGAAFLQRMCMEVTHDKHFTLIIIIISQTLGTDFE